MKMNYILDYPYFNLKVENISKADYKELDNYSWLESACSMAELLPSAVEDCWEVEEGEVYCKAEYSDEVANLGHSLGKLCYFLVAKGFTFKFEDKAEIAWNKLRADLAKAKTEA